MYDITDQLSAIDPVLAASGITADSATAGRRLYGINHATSRAFVGAVTATSEAGGAVTLTTTDADGAVTGTEQVEMEAVAARIAAVVSEIAYAGVEPADLRAARLASLRYVGEVGAFAKIQRDELIREVRAAGATFAEIATATGLSRAQLDRIVNERPRP